MDIIARSPCAGKSRRQRSRLILLAGESMIAAQRAKSRRRAAKLWERVERLLRVIGG